MARKTEGLDLMKTAMLRTMHDHALTLRRLAGTGSLLTRHLEPLIEALTAEISLRDQLATLATMLNLALDEADGSDTPLSQEIRSLTRSLPDRPVI